MNFRDQNQTPYFMSPCSLMSEFQRYTRTKWISTHSCESNTWEDRSASSCTSAVNLPHGKISTSTDHTGHSLITMDHETVTELERRLGSRSLWSQSSTTKQHVDKYYNSPQLSVMSGYIASCMVSHRVPSCTSELMSRSEGKSRDLWIYLPHKLE